MKKFLYSKFTKSTAALLASLIITAAFLLAANAAMRFKNDGGFVYGFENNFDNSDAFSSLLSDPADAVCDAYEDTPRGSDEFYREIKNNLADIPEGIEYYITINGERIASKSEITQDFDSMNPEYVDKYFCKSTFYTKLTYNKKDGSVAEGTSDRLTWNLPYFDDAENTGDDEIVIYSAVSAKYADNFSKIWHNQANYTKNTVIEIVALCLAALLVVLYLVCVCGKNADGSRAPGKTDRLWTEVHLAVLTIFAIGTLCADFSVICDLTDLQITTYIVYLTMGFVSFFGSLIILAAFLALVRSIKYGEFIKGSLTYKILCRLFNIGKRTRDRCKSFSAVPKKTAAILISLLFIYTAIIGICGISFTESDLGLFFGVMIFAFASFFIISRSNDCDKLKKAAHEIKGGNLTYKVSDVKSNDLKDFADDINSIGDGLNESVAQKLKAERMKTELITNVSHDLKTPLTSIINYSQLLSNMDNLPDEAKDYAAIINKKGERLKNLTQDLFDISKVQSGSETINAERLDISLLISQSLGEHTGEIEKSTLDFRTDLQGELYIYADGRKMSRVADNLINNILKYALENTRVYISSKEIGENAVIEFKNISASPMDFDDSEITERFVRGDKSRTKEGNGLGLAIAKSYTNACGGKFEIVTDGDLFKAIIVFNICK